MVMLGHGHQHWLSTVKDSMKVMAVKVSDFEGNKKGFCFPNCRAWTGSMNLASAQESRKTARSCSWESTKMLTFNKGLEETGKDGLAIGSPSFCWSSKKLENSQTAFRR